MISVFQLMEARNRFIAAKAELVRVRLQIEMMMKLEKYYRQGTFYKPLWIHLLNENPASIANVFIGSVGVMLGLAVIAYFIFRDTASSMAVEKDRLTIATVEQVEFSDYIRVIGRSCLAGLSIWMPSRAVVWKSARKEEGAMVKVGDVILRLSNPLLNIGIMQSEADLAYRKTSCVIPGLVWSRNDCN